MTALPNELYSLTNLQVLYAGQPQLVSVPSRLTQLHSLYLLDLSRSMLPGMPRLHSLIHSLSLSLSLSLTLSLSQWLGLLTCREQQRFPMHWGSKAGSRS